MHKKHHKEKSEGESKNLPTLSYLLKKGDSREIGYFQEINIAKTFGLGKIQYLWKLWEIIITNQPLLIISDSPTKCRFLLKLFLIYI